MTGAHAGTGQAHPAHGKTPTNPPVHIRYEVAIKTDATLTGTYRVNNGPWEPLNTTATLTNEPTTTITIHEAHNHLTTTN